MERLPATARAPVRDRAGSAQSGASPRRPRSGSGLTEKSKRLGIPETDDLGVLWNHFQTSSDFFAAIKIDHEAGFDELGEMWSNGRMLSGVMSLIFVVYNGYYLASFNIGIIWTFWLGPDAIEPPQLFLVSDTTFKAMGLREIPSVAILAIMELFMVVCIYAWAVRHLLYTLAAPTPAKKWHACATLFFSVIPTLGSMSMVRMLNYVTPQVLTPQLSWAIARLKYATTGSCELVWFVASRLLCLFAGFDAFMYKFQLIGLAISQEKANGYEDLQGLLLTTLIFVNQMLGVVQLGVFTKQRIFIFIFAGEDGQMSEKEEAIKLTWEAMVCSKLWEIHGPFKAMMIYLTFSDADFQKLVLDSKTGTTKDDLAPEELQEAPDKALMD